MQIGLFDGKYFYIWETFLCVSLVEHFFNKSYQSSNIMQIVGYQWEENIVGDESS
jgi:hypothetical protein